MEDSPHRGQVPRHTLSPTPGLGKAHGPRLCSDRSSLTGLWPAPPGGGTSDSKPGHSHIPSAYCMDLFM